MTNHKVDHFKNHVSWIEDWISTTLAQPDVWNQLICSEVNSSDGNLWGQWAPNTSDYQSNSVTWCMKDSALSVGLTEDKLWT
jgi:hypothetical protein